MLLGHIADVPRESGRVALAVEEVEDPVLLLLVFDDGILVEIEVIPAEADAYLDAALPRLHDFPVRDIEVLVDPQLVVERVQLVLVVLDGEVAHGLAAGLSLLVVRRQGLQHGLVLAIR